MLSYIDIGESEGAELVAVGKPVAIANDTTYGLTAGLWTRDIGQEHRSYREARTQASASGQATLLTYAQAKARLAL